MNHFDGLTEREKLIAQLEGAIQTHYQAANHALIAVESLKLVLAQLKAKRSRFDEPEATA